MTKELTPDNYKTDGQNPLVNLPAGAGTHTVYYYVTYTEKNAETGKDEEKKLVSGSKQVIIDKATRKAPDKLGTRAENFQNSKDGAITSITPRDMEYRDKFNDGKYTDTYYEEVIVGAGTYLVRWKADRNHYPSPDAEVIVQKGGAITVSFDSAGGSEIASATVAAYGDIVGSPAIQPEFEGATFLGWYLNRKAYDFKAPVMGNITLTAAWAPTAFILPNSTKAIGASAFKGLPAKAIGIPYGCASIGENAFQGCQNLTVIVIPASVTTDIPDTAFADSTQKIYVYGVKGTGDSGTSKAEEFCDKKGNEEKFNFVGYIDYPAPQPQATGE